MSQSPKPNGLSQSLVDRLVDGELTGDEYRRALELLDESPDGWKRCAVGFLEAQAWQRDLAGFLCDDPGSMAASANLDADAPTERPSEASQLKSPRSPRAGSWNWPVLGPFASAAALVCAFVSGWLIQPPQSARQPLSVAQPASSDIPLARPASLREPSGQIELAFDGADQNEQPLQVPFYGVDNYDTNPREVDDLLKYVTHEGAQVSRYRAVYPEELNDRESVLVPIEFISVHPTGDFQ